MVGTELVSTVSFIETKQSYTGCKHRFGNNGNICRVDEFKLFQIAPLFDSCDPNSI